MQLKRDIVSPLRAGKGESAIGDASIFEDLAIGAGTVPPGDHNKDFKDVESEPAAFEDVGGEVEALDRDMDAEVEALDRDMDGEIEALDGDVDGEIEALERDAGAEAFGGSGAGSAVGNAGVSGAEREVENALLKSALGYTVTVRKPFKLKEVRNRSGEGKVETERVEYAEEQIHVPGKITAQIYWLRRRGAKCAAQGVDPLREVLRRWDEG